MRNVHPISPITSKGVARRRCSPSATPVERLHFHTVVSEGGCWLWQGELNSMGYGRITVAGQRSLVHRYAYVNLVGPIPPGLVLDHLCRVPRCCNPAHLEPVPQGTNSARGESPNAIRIRRGSCDFGHPYEINARGLECRTCKKAYMDIWRATPSVTRAARKAAGVRVVDLSAHYRYLAPTA